MFRISCLAVLFLSLATVVSCGKKEISSKQVDEEAEQFITDGLSREQAAKVVAKVGDREITVGDVTAQINRLSPYVRRRWATPEKRKEFLQKMVEIELLAAEAERHGLDKDPRVQQAVRQVMIRLLVKNDLQKEVLPNQVDDEILKAAYEKNWTRYHQPKQYRISEVVLVKEADAAALLKEIMASKDPMATFRAAAFSKSINRESGERGGDVGYVINPVDLKPNDERGPKQNPNVDQAIIDAAVTLSSPGQFFPKLVKTDQGFHIIMLSSIKPAMNRSFNSVRRLIENKVLRKLRREKMDEYVAGLRKKARVKVFEENLAKAHIEVSEDELLPYSPKPTVRVDTSGRVVKTAESSVSAKKTVAAGAQKESGDAK